MLKKTMTGKMSSILKAAGLALCLCTAGMSSCMAAQTDEMQPLSSKEETADGSAIISTDYPGVSAKPGASVTFPLYIVNSGSTEEDAQLGVEGLPDGWTGYFRGSDSEISRVHIRAGQEKSDSPKLSYLVTIPEDAKDGDYTFAIQAQGISAEDAAGSASIAQAEITVTVKAQEAGQSDFTTQYPEQQGDTSTHFSFDATIVNNRLTDQSYALSAQAPEGWSVTFTPSGETTKVASIPVEAGKSQGMTIAITPSETAEQGDYDIPVTAVSSDDTLNLDLQVAITGTYGVVLSTSTGNLSANAYAGEEAKITMAVTNSGNIDLENLQLAAQGSTDWNIRFDETTIDLLEAGATKEITAYVQPAKNAVIGDYVTVMTVKNAQVKSEADLRIAVKNHTTWGIAAIVIIAAVCICIGAVIHKYGRR